MQLNPFRVTSVIVLIAVVMMFTGLSAPVSAAPLEKPQKSCCDECNKGEGQSPDHCSTPDCPMFFCLSMNMVSPSTPSIQTESVFVTQPAREFHLSISTKPIFHPPIVA